MSEEEFGQIRPRSVPLSHVKPVVATQDKASASASSRLPWLLVIGLAVLAGLLVFLIIPSLVNQPQQVISDVPDQPDIATPSAPVGSGAPAGEQLPPFEALLREQAREAAQEQLARFVELQMALEKSMRVDSWGQLQFDAAKGLATQGDERFIAEKFDESLARYREAGDALEALIGTGESLLEEVLGGGERALSDRDEVQAITSFEQALIIDPDNEQATNGLQRARNLPEVVRLLRQAKNFELNGDWRDALKGYTAVQAIDPLTDGLELSLQEARIGVTDLQIREHLTQGFAAMDADNYPSARASFRKVLKLKPDHPIALGGLEQVAERADLTQIERRRQAARQAESAEQWQAAIDAYEAVLKLDSNIQFAKDGKTQAATQLRTQVTLGNIIASPDKLSSSALFSQAKTILNRAEKLQPQGPDLAEHIAEVTRLIKVYGMPVEVTFHSDNRTDVTLSTVGRLGAFSEKQIVLRPGAYTVIGSRDGCRDVRTSILVRPDMQPIDIRCSETF